MTSPNVQAIRKVLHNPPMLPRYYYTGLGEMSASFRLGKLLGNSDLEVATTGAALFPGNRLWMIIFCLSDLLGFSAIN